MRPPYQGTALDPFMRGAKQAAYEGLLNEPATFGIGFALIPDHVDQLGLPNGWVMGRFSSIPEAILWMSAVVSQYVGRYVYRTLIPRVPARWPTQSQP
jgi:hypothetical protein